MEPVVRVRVRVRGRVQGVWYRASTQERALALGLSGWVRNLVDGGVELEAQGPSAAVDALVSWCRTGPPMARVDDIAVQKIEPQVPAGSFEVRR